MFVSRFEKFVYIIWWVFWKKTAVYQQTEAQVYLTLKKLSYSELSTWLHAFSIYSSIRIA